MSSLVARAQQAAATAAQYCDDVDREGRFPHETIRALREARLMSAAIPVDLGGEGSSLAEIAEVCSLLAQSCASSAMTYAMHQIKLSSVILHGASADWHRGFMRKVCDEQLLIASATTEGGIGGDVRNSICAVERDGNTFRLQKDGCVISYGQQADVILVTARSAPHAPSSDQVMVVVTKDQFQLERIQTWDTLGMRGTCSEGFKLSVSGNVDQILPGKFGDTSAKSMLATSHLLWSSIWYGIANNALSRAQSFVRVEARRNPSQTPPGALRVAEAANMLQMMKSNTLEGLRRYERARLNEDEMNGVAFVVAMNNIKTGASRMAIDIINHALLITGIAGYRNNTPYSVGRHMRDAMSAPIMISNDRIFGNMANLLLMHRLDPNLLS